MLLLELSQNVEGHMNDRVDLASHQFFISDDQHQDILIVVIANVPIAMSLNF